MYTKMSFGKDWQEWSRFVAIFPTTIIISFIVIIAPDMSPAFIILIIVAILVVVIRLCPVCNRVSHLALLSVAPSLHGI
jgi:hypothetical protein